MIHRFLREKNGKATIQEIFNALSSNDEDKRLIIEKIRMMERFGMVTVEGNLVTIRK